MTTRTVPNRLGEALVEMANDMYRLGIMDEATHEKITVRHLGKQPVPTAEPFVLLPVVVVPVPEPLPRTNVPATTVVVPL